MHETARPVSYLDEAPALLRSRATLAWLTTLDHKRLAVLYLAASSVALAGAGALSVARGDGGAALKVGGALFVVPGIVAVIGNFALPLQLGQASAALPRTSLFGFWLYVAAAALLGAGLVPSTGELASTPSAVTCGGVLTLGLSATCNGLNVLATVARAFTSRAAPPRLTLFAWSLVATSAAQVMSFVALVGLAAAVALGHVGAPLGFEAGDLAARIVARPWTHLAPFGLLTVVPAAGVVGDVIAAFAGRRPPVALALAAWSVSALAWLGLVDGAGSLLADAVSRPQVGLAQALVGLSLAVWALCGAATLHGGDATLASPLVWSLGTLFQLTVAAPAAWLLGVPITGAYLQGTAFEVGYREGLLAGASGMGFVAGLLFFWPKITGKLYNERLAHGAFALVFLGLQAAFLPALLRAFAPGLPWLERGSTVGLGGVVVGALATLVLGGASLRWGAQAPDNPWGVEGLEWSVPSPPPFDNVPFDPDAAPAQSDGLTGRADGRSSARYGGPQRA